MGRSIRGKFDFGGATLVVAAAGHSYATANKKKL
jgi:hypothetical protein